MTNVSDKFECGFNCHKTARKLGLNGTLSAVRQRYLTFTILPNGGGCEKSIRSRSVRPVPTPNVVPLALANTNAPTPISALPCPCVTPTQTNSPSSQCLCFHK